MIRVKIFRHKWKKDPGLARIRFKKCERCGLEQWFDFDHNTTVYYDPSTGKTTRFQKVPECKFIMHCDKI